MKFQKYLVVIFLLPLILLSACTTNTKTYTSESVLTQLRSMVNTNEYPAVPSKPTNQTETLKHYTIISGLDLTFAVSENDVLKEVGLVCPVFSMNGAAGAHGYYSAALLTIFTETQANLEYVAKELDFEHPWTGYDFERTCERNGINYSFSCNNSTWTFVITLN